MRLLAILMSIVVVSAGLFALYVRIAPSDPAIWHVDPRDTLRRTSRGGILVRDTGGDLPAPRFDDRPQRVLDRLHQIVMAQPRLSVLSGSTEEGHITYVARSRLWGFPDYISVVAYPHEGQTALAIYARLRFGSSDLGVNRARVEGWLAQMQTAA